MPDSQSALMFEMHENADIARDLNNTKFVLENLSLVYGQQMMEAGTSENSANSSESLVVSQDSVVTMSSAILDKVAYLVSCLNPGQWSLLQVILMFSFYKNILKNN